MKLVEMKCKNCGAVLQAKLGTTDIHCDHCKANYKLDDEVKRVKYVDMENAGYEYEKGRLRARIEHEKALTAELDKQVEEIGEKLKLSNMSGRATPEKKEELTVEMVKQRFAERKKQGNSHEDYDDIAPIILVVGIVILFISIFCLANHLYFNLF